MKPRVTGVCVTYLFLFVHIYFFIPEEVNVTLKIKSPLPVHFIEKSGSKLLSASTYSRFAERIF